jgi:hypothetical protein
MNGASKASQSSRGEGGYHQCATRKQTHQLALEWQLSHGHRKRLEEEILKQDEKTVSSRVGGGRGAIYHT